jgi:predicted esterase YcpF (UPF0227 family)
MLLYIHGFNSAPASHKARLLKQRLEAMGRGNEFTCPALPDRPAYAMAMLEEQLSRVQPAEVTLVGSSLGGYYATYLAEKIGVRAVLVNPAVEPYLGLQAYLGPQKNIYTGATYELTHRHLEELLVLDVDRPTRLSRYYLMVTTGDEVLDYRKAVQKYAGAKQLVVQGSDHGFGDFGDYLESVLEFAGIA